MLAEDLPHNLMYVNTDQHNQCCHCAWLNSLSNCIVLILCYGQMD